MKKARMKFYVGRKSGHVGKQIFKSDILPTKADYPQFVSVVGPFRTRRAAIFYASFGQDSNPHVRSVSDAERIAKSALKRASAWDLPITRKDKA